MRRITATLAVVFIALFPFQAQAENAYCRPPHEMHDFLIKTGMFLFTYGMSDENFLIAIYIGQDHFVVVAESGSVACVLTGGRFLYTVEDRGI